MNEMAEMNEMTEMSAGPKLKVSIIGAGYVGFALTLTFSSMDFTTYCMDRDSGKIGSINAGIPPLFEPGADKLLREGLTSGTIIGTCDLKEGVAKTSISFICVGTPPDDEGRPDLGQIEDAAHELGAILREKEGYHVVVVKSTVPPGTTMRVIKPILEEVSGKKTGRDFGLAMCPEFLREGSALKDCMDPDRLILGVSDDLCGETLGSLYRDFQCPKLVTDATTAEMVKYCSNSFLATKISFANEFANLCEAMNVDVDDVFEGIGLDGRISPLFFRSGIGFGGSCFPKDVLGIIEMAADRDVNMSILRAVMDVNDHQYMRVVDKLERYLDIEGRTVAVLGLAFKPGTDDVRGTRSLPVIRMLVERGARIRAYDPEATENFKRFQLEGDIIYTSGWRDALRGAEAVIICTDWPEFLDIDEGALLKLMARPLVIDGRRLFVDRRFEHVTYETIGTLGDR